MKNIILIGLRGSGKTKLGKILAQKINFKFVDLDEEIEKTANKKIPQIVEENNWEHFRNLETEEIKKLLNTEQTVIATGGGAALKKENQELLKNLGTIIYLNQSPVICAARIEGDKNRPSLTEEKTLEKELQKLIDQ